MNIVTWALMEFMDVSRALRYRWGHCLNWSKCSVEIFLSRSRVIVGSRTWNHGLSADTDETWEIKHMTIVLVINKD